MQKLSTSTNVTIFLLFFGASVIDALVSHHWWRSAFWLAVGLVFLGASRFGRRA